MRTAVRAEGVFRSVECIAIAGWDCSVLAPKGYYPCGLLASNLVLNLAPNRLSPAEVCQAVVITSIKPACQVQVQDI